MAMFQDLTLILADSGSDAEEIARHTNQAIDYHVKRFGPEHPYTIMAYKLYGFVYLEMKMFHEAKAHLQIALETSNKALGNSHRLTQFIAMEYGYLLGISGDYEIGKEYFTNSIEKLSALELWDEDVKPTLVLWSSLHEENGDLEMAEISLRKSLDIARNQFGDIHAEVASSMNILGVFLDKHGDLESAEQLLREAIDIWHQLNAIIDTDIILYHQNLALNLEDQEKFTEALQYHSIILDMRTQLSGPGHPETLVDMWNKGVCHQKMGMNQEAIDLMKQVLESEIKILGELHADTLYSYWAIADLLKEDGQYVDAEELAIHCYPMYQKIYGPTHAETLDVAELLIEIYELTDRPELAQDYLTLVEVHRPASQPDEQRIDPGD